MGGGSSSFSSRDPSDVLRQLAEAQKDTRSEAYESECADLLGTLLVGFNNRDQGAIQTHLNEIKHALERDIDGTLDIRFAGSVAKHTWIDGLSDVDSLVMLDKCELSEGSPADAKEYLEQRLAERFPRTEITQGDMAVTVHFSDVDIQLLPAVSCDGTVKIPDASGKGWASVRPKEFTRALTDVNQANGGKVVPVVKLAKAIVADLPQSQQITGYHTESLAVNVFRNYTGPHRTKDMLAHFFSEAARQVLQPVRDRTGQSVHVDEYLGEPLSATRRRISDSFSRIFRSMQTADATADVDTWKRLFSM